MTLKSFVDGPGEEIEGDASYDTDVFVVGTGPMGATTALLLATYGTRVTMISRYRWLANSPRAHITNQRAAEVFRDAGIEEELKRYAMPWDLMAYTGFVSSLAGPEFARIDSWGCGDRRGDYAAASPSEPMDLPQTFLEPVLVNNAAARGAKVLFNTEYLSHEEDEAGVTVRLRDRISGDEFSQRARYLVGADGGSSLVARNAGLAFHGRRGKSGTVYARFKADLTSLVAHRPGVITVVMQPAMGEGDTGTGILRCVRPWTEWIAGWGFDPEAGDPDLSEEHALDRIRSFIGDDGVEIDFLGTSVWYVNEEYAESMSTERVFIGGDAAHRHPPNNGLGSNTCVQDAFNLAWKLSYVVRGDASPALLSSYGEERQPVAQAIVERANRSRAEFAQLRGVFERILSQEGDLAEVLRSPGPEHESLRAEFHDAVDVKRFEYQAHGFEMNQRYRSSAIVPDESAPEEFERDAVLYAQPSARAGAKVPHAWVADRAGRPVSTLDLVGKGAFTLVTGLAGRSWADAARALGLPWLRALVFGAADAQDLRGAWRAVTGLGERDVLLVRPDGVIAWRGIATAATPAEIEGELRGILSRIL